MKQTKILIIMLLAFVTMSASECVKKSKDPNISDTGVKKTSADITTGSDGLTVEQRNIKKRLEVDNEIGSIKHLYIISAMSGQVILYSTVDGKVTSGGKRLTNPTTLAQGDGEQYTRDFVMPRIQDDGTYGSSMNYLFWFDVKGVYHQHYVAGGQIVHISAEALPVSEISINLSK